MKKKLLSMLLVASMATSLLIGCGGKKTYDDSEPYEVVVELIGMGEAQADTAKIEEAINKISLEKINCTIKFREIAIADHAQQLNLLGTDGDRLDIVFVGYTTSMQDLVSNGLLVDIGQYLDEYAPDIVKDAGILLDACKVNGSTYCVPGNYYPSMKPTISYNVEKFAECGIEIPAGENDSLEYADKFYRAIKNSSFDGYAYTAGDGMSLALPGYHFEKFGSAMGADGVYGILLDMVNDTTIVNPYETEEFRTYCKQVRKWFEDGIIVPDSLTSGNNLMGGLQSGQIIALVGEMNSTGVYNYANIAGQSMEGITYGDTYLTGTSIPEMGLGVTVTSERPEKAVQMLNLIMSDPDVANLMNYGIEGEHYVKVSDHIIAYPEGVNPMELGWGMAIVTFGDSSKIYQRTPYTEDWYNSLDAFKTENAKISQAFGYVFDTSSVRTQVAACSSVIAEYNPSLQCGMIEDVDSHINDFVSKLKDAGIDDIIAENQKQFDAWRANK